MSEEIDIIKKRRKILRGLTTKLMNKIESCILEQTDESVNKSDKIDILNEMQEQLSSKAKDLKDLDALIENQIDESELENEIISSEELKEKIIHFKLKIMNHVKCLSKNNPISETPKPDQNFQTEVNNYSHVQESKVKLPKLTLPKFNGDPCLWLEFWNQYKNSIHENESLTNIEKFSYLKQLVVGNAASSISGFTLGSENYIAAIEILQNRFGRKDLVVNSHMTKLLSMDPVKNINNITALRKLYDECETQIRNLNSLNITSGSYGQLLCPILIKLIPDQIALEFNRIRKLKDFDVTELMEFIRTEIECRESSNILSNCPKPKPYSSSFEYEKRNQKRIIPTASALISNVSKNCVFCSRAHESSSCTELAIEQKRKKIIDQGLCLKCIKRGHRSNQCWSKVKPCKICNSINHCTASCGIRLKGESENNSHSFKNQAIVSTSHINNSGNSENCSENIILQTCSALISENYKSKVIRILMDSASQKSFLSSKVAKELKLPIIRKEKLFVYAFGARNPFEKIYDVVRIKLANRKDPGCNIEIEALVTSCITGAKLSTPNGHMLKKIMKTKGFELADVQSNKPIDLLIGANYFWSVNTGEIIKLSDHMYGIKSLFGWSLQGKSNLFRNESSDCAINCMSVSADKLSCHDSELNDQLKAFWDLESLGITQKDYSSNFDSELIDKFEKNLKFVEGRYQTRLLWGLDTEGLQSNFRIAEKQFIKLRNELKGNEWLLENYTNVINEYLKEGIVEDADLGINRTYYMPHRAVVRTDKETTKVRIVFNGSSRNKNCSSLNQCLLTGPNLNPSVLDMILKFREHKIAFSCDLKQAFLQIQIDPKDRDYLRFIWFRNDVDDYNDLRILRMTRVPFGVACSPFILSEVIKHHIKGYKEIKPEAYHMLNNYFYVDDLFYGSNTIDKALELSRDAVTIMNDAHMHLRKFRTNSPELKALWEEKDMIKLEDNVENSVNILGINWDYNKDLMKINASSLLEILPHMKYTKRFVLQLAARVFDPAGFLAPFVVRIKCLLQELWKLGLDWDEVLPDDVISVVNSWCSEIESMANLALNRYYFESDFVNELRYQLHIFSDANPQVYGAVAYFRYSNSNGNYNTSFVISKSRVAPIKKLSLPRVELMGALIAARLANYLMKLFEIPNTKIYLWSDSLIVLHWLKGSASRWKPFVANRVTEIQELTDPAWWRHCSGSINPADIITKGATLEKLITDEKWWSGPEFLKFSEDKWPKPRPTNPKDQELSEEQKEVLVAASLNDSYPINETLIDFENYSSLTRVIRITAWIIRFIKKLQRAQVSTENNLNAEEIKISEETLIKIVQTQSFPTECEILKNQGVIAKDSKLVELDPFIDESGILRIGGRLQNSKFQFEEKHPILLPAKHKFTELLIKFVHERVAHSGVAHTLSSLRSKYWIIRGRQYVKFVLNKCTICKKYSSQPGVQVMAPLPSARSCESPPFTICGLDFAGPLFCKNSDSKYYILLATCAVTRAIHLELVNDLTTETFLLAFRRFIGRRGLCHIVYTDNAKTFKKADQDLQKIFRLINHPDLKDYYSAQGIQWRYIVDRGAWWGGFYERLVRSVKTSLRKTISRSSLTVKELETVLIEIESIINSRPITYVYSDLNEPTSLTPAHFLIGKRLSSLPPVKIYDDTFSSTRDVIIKRYNYREKLLEHFWNRWRQEYLFDLKSANTVVPPKRVATEIKVNDIVLISDKKYPRNVWKLGRVVELFTGRDGKVRSCALKINTGIIKRPVQLIHSLELNQ